MITAMGGQNTKPAGAAAGELDRRFHASAPLFVKTT
jgi:hypothetical protein